MTTPIVYPPLHPEKKPYDPSTSIYWQYYTEEERQMLLDHPIDYTSSGKDILRQLLEDIKYSQKMPPSTPP